jgi:hypothetical protein
LQLFDTLHFSEWLGRLRDLAASPAVLEILVLQLACIIAAFLSAWAVRAATRSWTDGLVERVTMRYRVLRVPAGVRGLAVFCYAWLILVFTEETVAQLGGDYRLIGIAASLTGLWIVIRASALLVRDPLLARAVAAIAWIIAALDIMGLLPAASAALDNLAITIGTCGFPCCSSPRRCSSSRSCCGPHSASLGRSTPGSSVRQRSALRCGC